jgi:hypothetical protein
VKRSRFVSVVALVGASLLSMTALASPSSDLNEAMSVDGLQKTTVKGLDLAYVRPGATLAGYNSIQLAPVYVAFVKGWTATAAADSPFPVSSSMRETIRQQVATLVHDAFVKELQTKGGFPIVDASGPHVLLVKINIINLDVVAPVEQSAGMSATWTRSAGQATLYAELFDSETGQVIARVIDAQPVRNGRNDYYMDNAINAQWIAEAWAKTLVNGLDRARAQMATAAPAAAP